MITKLKNFKSVGPYDTSALLIRLHMPYNRTVVKKVCTYTLYVSIIMYKLYDVYTIMTLYYCCGIQSNACQTVCTVPYCYTFLLYIIFYCVHETQSEAIVLQIYTTLNHHSMCMRTHACTYAYII